MKKTIFSLNLFKEGFRQLKLLGIVSLVIISLQTFLIGLGSVIFNLDDTSMRTIGFFDLNPLLITLIYIIAPLMTLSLFGFMNKRKASDFYHSISQKRSTLFISFYLAIVSWLLIITTVSTLIGIIMHILSPAHFTISYYNIIISTVNIVIAAIYSSSAILLAMTLTGTLFTNIAVSSMLLFIPRIFITVLVETVTSALPLIRRLNNIPVITKDYNIFTSILFRPLLGFTDYEYVPTSNYISGIYTFVLAAAVFLIGLAVFKHRKSETAGNSALNKFLQNVFRIIPCMIICLIVCAYIFSIITEDIGLDIENLFLICVLYVAALVVYFLYEIITTKKLRNLVKTLPSLIIVVALNIVIILSMYGIYNSVLSFYPESEDIDYIRIAASSDSYGYSTINDYFEIKAENIKISDERFKNIVSHLLKNDIDEIKTDKYYSSASYTFNHEYKNMTFIIKTKTGEHYRNIRVINNAEKELNSILSEIEEYKEIYITLPDLNDPQTTISSDYYISQRELKAIYNIMRLELSKTDFNKWMTFMSESDTDSYLDSFTISTVINGQNINFRVNLYSKLFPEAAKEYLKNVNIPVNSKDIYDKLGNPSDIYSAQIDFYGNYNDTYYIYEHEAEFKKLKEHIVDTDEIDLTKPFVKVTVILKNELENKEHISFYQYDSDELIAWNNGYYYDSDTYYSDTRVR